MAYVIKTTTFAELIIGAAFKCQDELSWFKKSQTTAVGQKPNQGPKGRHEKKFPGDAMVYGEVAVSN